METKGGFLRRGDIVEDPAGRDVEIIKILSRPGDRIIIRVRDCESGGKREMRIYRDRHYNVLEE